MRENVLLKGRARFPTGWVQEKERPRKRERKRGTISADKTQIIVKFCISIREEEVREEEKEREVHSLDAYALETEKTKGSG